MYSQTLCNIRPRWWSFTRDSNYKALPGKILVFWVSHGWLWELVAHGGSTVCLKLYFVSQPD